MHLDVHHFVKDLITMVASEYQPVSIWSSFDLLNSEVLRITVFLLNLFVLLQLRFTFLGLVDRAYLWLQSFNVWSMVSVICLPKIVLTFGFYWTQFLFISKVLDIKLWVSMTATVFLFFITHVRRLSSALVVKLHLVFEERRLILNNDFFCLHTFRFDWFVVLIFVDNRGLVETINIRKIWWVSRRSNLRRNYLEILLVLPLRDQGSCKECISESALWTKVNRHLVVCIDLWKVSFSDFEHPSFFSQDYLVEQVIKLQLLAQNQSGLSFYT